eukprot:4184320-Amphidinium_carterae.1
MVAITFSCAAMASCKDSCEGGAGSAGLSAPADGPFDLPRRLLPPFPLPVPPSCGGLRDGLGAPRGKACWSFSTVVAPVLV